jgi:hypothetical protein
MCCYRAPSILVSCISVKVRPKDITTLISLCWSEGFTPHSCSRGSQNGTKDQLSYNQDQPTQLKLLTNSTGLDLVCPSPSSATSSLTLPPFAATTVLLLLNPLCFGVLQGVGSISPNNTSPSSPESPSRGVLTLQSYSEEFVGYKGDTIVVVMEVL